MPAAHHQLIVALLPGLGKSLGVGGGGSRGGVGWGEQEAGREGGEEEKGGSKRNFAAASFSSNDLLM